jgi:hypothetical protein
MEQGSETLHARKNESHPQNKQMTAVKYSRDTDEVMKASSSNIHRDGAAAFKLQERQPLPPAESANDLPGGQTKVLNVRQMNSINLHPDEGDVDSPPECISDTSY